VIGLVFVLFGIVITGMFCSWVFCTSQETGWDDRVWNDL